MQDHDAEDSEYFGFTDVDETIGADAHPLSSFASKINTTETVKSEINLNKSSIQLQPLAEKNKYSLRFLYDSTKDVTVSIFLKYHTYFS